ncbi:MAG: glycosyltransferase family 2 protein [Sphingobacteriales bacterium]|nr:MAG: glycosyltransferase family 2 protein [Sphingobacteriales bacterium]TAF81755.1 MAG: glycosyltransferase family 2 protein [Sphingobacteriales bacterium]
MIYLLYTIFLFLILRFTVTLFNFISNPKLTTSPKNYNCLVSVLIPARNEQQHILTLLQSLKKQDYQSIEVIIYDDASTDYTLAICQNFCATDDRFTVIGNSQLPQGWMGKNHACYQLAKKAKGTYFLFLDADEVVSNGLINNAIHRMETGKLALLSLFANQIMLTIGEKMVVPLMHFLLLNLLPLRLVKVSKNPSIAAASGQFMMFDAAIYKSQFWHKQVKNKVVEDIEIMKKVKQFGYKGETLLANNYLHCRMYASYSEALHGFSKNILAGFGGSYLGLTVFVLLIGFGFPLICVFFSFKLVFLAFVLIFITKIMISLMAGQNIFANLILHFAQFLTLLLLTILSIYKSITQTQVWKGRSINGY